MSDREEEIFVKEVEKTIKKPKRKLTEKQLENLAKGREKMRLKREEAKKKGEIKMVKASDKGAKEQQKETKKKHKEKRRTLKEINKEKEEQLLARLEKEEAETNNKKQIREDLFQTLKLKCLEKASSVKDYNEIKQALDGIDNETLHNDEKLKTYALKVMKPYIKEKEQKANLQTEVKEL